jgi:hypothetical protein
LRQSEHAKGGRVVMRCKVCCDLPGRACVACSRGVAAPTLPAELRCALCEQVGHVSRYCLATTVGIKRARAARKGVAA